MCACSSFLWQLQQNIRLESPYDYIIKSYATIQLTCFCEIANQPLLAGNVRVEVRVFDFDNSKP